MHRVSINEIIIGEPLRWDVFNGQGALLLRKGFIVTSEQQINSLIERGLYVEHTAVVEKNQVAVPLKEMPSAYRYVLDVVANMERVLPRFEQTPDAKDRIVEAAIRLEQAVQLHTDVALATILLNREGRYSVRHAVDCAVVAIVFAKAIGKTKDVARSLACAALTMNIGMLQLQDSLQRKKGPPSEEEQQHIRQHPITGVELLKRAGVTDTVWLNCVMDHHENEDGSGYCQQKRGADIAEEAKILALIDRYTARISSRTYRVAQLPNAAFRGLLMEDKETLFPELSSRFIKHFGIYPVGTFVRLHNGEIGIVTARGDSTTTPVVCAVVSARGEALIHPIRRDTAMQGLGVQAVIDEKTAAVKISLQALWGDIAAS